MLGPGGGRDRVQHHPDALRQLLEEDAVDGLETRQRGELDHTLHLAFEEGRNHQQAPGRRLADPRADANVAGRQLVNGENPLLHRALADQPFARTEPFARARAGMAVRADAPQRRRVPRVFGYEQGRVLRGNLRRELPQHDAAQLFETAPSLQEAGDAGQVRGPPVLALVGLRALAQVHDHLVDAVGEVLPAPRHARHVGLATQLALRADLPGNADHLGGEGAQLIDHRVHGGLEVADLAPGRDRDLARELSVGDRGGHQRDVSDLRGEVPGERIHALGQVLPGAGDPRDLRLPAELSFGADLAGHPRHLRGEGAELIDHLVDGFLQLQDLAPGRNGDLPGEVATRHRRGDQRDVAHLAGQVAGEHVDVVGQVIPDAADAPHLRLRSQRARGAHFLPYPDHIVPYAPSVY